MAFRTFFLLATLFLTLSTPGTSHATIDSLIPEGTAYQNTIPAPLEHLGFEMGERPVHHHEILSYFKTLSEASNRMILLPYGKSSMGRDLVYAVVSSPENIARIESIQHQVNQLADPRTLSRSDAESLAEKLPAVVWMEHAIHGNELSGSDSAIRLVYQLTAGTDSSTNEILENLVICIDPLANPDGRERELHRVLQWRSSVPNPDRQSRHLADASPSGRTNKYLFDLNRDWILLTQTETRHRIPTILEWTPQVFIDIHEMGSSTYLFSPPRPPLTPNLGSMNLEWWPVFMQEQAAAFDSYGYTYYTGEWNESWYPGYATSWSGMIGAVGILYEQAQTDGQSVIQPDGVLLGYPQAVHQQYVSSIANLQTAANNRSELVLNYYEDKATWLNESKRNGATFLIPPSDNPSRLRDFTEHLQLLGIEIEVATESFSANRSISYWGETRRDTFPEGTLLVSTHQPLGRLVDSAIDFDHLWDNESLKEERDELELHGRSKTYDVMAWSLPLAYNIECYRMDGNASVESTPYIATEPYGASVRNPGAAFGYAFTLEDDAAYHALAHLLDHDYVVRSSRESFTFHGNTFPRGSILVQRTGSPAALDDTIRHLAEKHNVAFMGLQTAKAETGLDLGGRGYPLLEAPRVAIMTGDNVNSYQMGYVWYLLDSRMKMRASLLKSSRFSSYDLTKYNVLIFPSGSYSRYVTESRIREFMADGGTVIAMDGARGFFTSEGNDLSSVKQVRNVLDQLADYKQALDDQNQMGQYTVDPEVIWGNKEPELAVPPTKDPSVNRSEADDARLRLFSPIGVIAHVDLDDSHWLTTGMDDRVPVMLESSSAYVSKSPVQTIGRYAGYDDIRLSGLFWPEGRTRWADTTFMTRERVGRGQLILFLNDPLFRNYFRGTERLVLNALLLGPGLGASQGTPWEANPVR